MALAVPDARDDAAAVLPDAGEKAAVVQSMFDRIAPRYDRLNAVMTLRLDRGWRRATIDAAEIRPGDRVLDVACGTGDLTQAFASQSNAGSVIGVDFTPEMLKVAGAKRESLPTHARAKVTYAEGDAQNLAFPDASFDVVSIAFGIRNVADPMKALSEFARVLKPGGRLVILEFDRPSFAPVRWFNDFYCGWVMPRTATLISGDKSGAYKYLPKSVGSFMPRATLCTKIAESGFEAVVSTGLTMGICVCYRGVRSAE